MLANPGYGRCRKGQASVTMEWVQDPQNPISEGAWKPVVHFAETSTALVVNKSRAEMLSALVQSPLLKHWAKVGQVAIKPGIYGAYAQIVIERTPIGDHTIDDVNADLFAEKAQRWEPLHQPLGVT